MPFKECSIVESREEFCRLAERRGVSFGELCRRWGISRPTGYKWLGRWTGELASLRDRSRRPRVSPGRTADELEALVLGVRGEHPAWGGRKIRRLLENEGVAGVPSASTITEILRRHGRLDGPGAGAARGGERFERAAPNELWQMDFKGHFAMREGRCHPLTVLDDHSRYSLGVSACDNERAGTVQVQLTRLFERYGLPWQILADNGSPWGTAGSEERHTVLTVWLLDLGVEVIHGRPFHPQTQGKDERFHRTLMAEVINGRIFDNLAEAQKAFDEWRPIYNDKRPHEGIAMAVPSSRYKPSPRAMPTSVPKPEYESQAHVRKVRGCGAVSFKGRRVPVSKAFAGRYVALRATNVEGRFDLCYRHHRLGQVDLAQAMV